MKWRQTERLQKPLTFTHFMLKFPKEGGHECCTFRRRSALEELETGSEAPLSLAALRHPETSNNGHSESNPVELRGNIRFLNSLAHIFGALGNARGTNVRSGNTLPLDGGHVELLEGMLCELLRLRRELANEDSVNHCVDYIKRKYEVIISEKSPRNTTQKHGFLRTKCQENQHMDCK